MSDDKSLSVTQEITPPTAADVLEVFQHFQASILNRIDARDENVLSAIRKIVSDVLEMYQKQTARTDDHEKRIKETERWLEILKGRYNELASDMMAMKLKQKRAEQSSG